MISPAALRRKQPFERVMADQSAQLRDEVSRISAALRNVVATQATHTEMLKAILDAATEAVPEGDLMGILLQILKTLDMQTTYLRAIHTTAGGGDLDVGSDG